MADSSENLDLSLRRQHQLYEQATRRVRWAVIAITIATVPLVNGAGLVVLVLAVVAGIYNSSRYWRWLLTKRVFASRIFTLVADNVLIAGLVMITGGTASAYLGYFALSLVSAAYWYGLRGAWWVFAGQWALIATGLFWQQWPKVEIGATRQIIIRAGWLLLVGILVALISRIERQRRFLISRFTRQVSAEKQRLLTLLNSLSDPVMAVDPNGKVTLYNGAALELLNTNVNLTGRLIERVLPLRDQRGHRVDMVQLIGKSRSSIIRNDLSYKTTNDEVINLEVGISPIESSFASKTKETGGFMVILRDITKEKTLDEQREEFVAVASHELRTPIAVAEANLATALLPKVGNLDPKLQPLLKQAYDNVLFLSDLVNDLTTLAKAEQEHLSLDLAPIEPSAILDKLVTDNVAEAKAKALALKAKVGANLKPIFTSEHLLLEILQNLVSNAIKYTQTGGVTLGVVAATNDRVLFSVADTGIGIAASDQKHLFEKFYRAEDYRTRESRGTGLGLYISQKLARRLNAKIWYKSRFNHGTTFYLEVPPFSQLAKDHPKVVRAQLKDYVETL
ncbi:PAS domain S-box protein [Candidatus Microgenomates bacterium]|nr:PAS domain S-box protein [Candidatus Microgenomates bacterium]